MAAQQDRPHSKTEFMRLLVEAGFTDFVLLDEEAAEAVLTDRRLELLEHLRDHEVESVTALAEAPGRDKSAVSRDLDLLWEESLVDYEPEGRRKVPVLAHETVLVEPIL